VYFARSRHPITRQPKRQTRTCSARTPATTLLSSRPATSCPAASRETRMSRERAPSWSMRWRRATLPRTVDSLV
jgi:hypothetical protein